MTVQITGVALLESGIELGYLTVDKDARENGLLWRHSVMIPRDSDYDDALDGVEKALAELLADVLDDEDRVPPLVLDAPEDEDDE